MTDKLSRRSILARAVAGTAATAIPVAASALVAPEPLDAELLALGSELEPIFAEYLALKEDDRRFEAALDAEIKRRVGMSAPPNFDYHDDLTGYWATRSAILDERMTTCSDEPWTSIHDRLFPLAEKILSYRPKSRAGFAVQVRAFMLTDAIDIDCNGDLEPQERRLLDFFASASGFAGVAFPQAATS